MGKCKRTPHRIEWLRKYQLTWINRRREDWLKANGPCCKCGSWERLEIDHIEPSTKDFEASNAFNLKPDNPKRVAELAKCQVLCHDCHLEKSRPQLRAAALKRWSKRVIEI